MTEAGTVLHAVAKNWPRNPEMPVFLWRSSPVTTSSCDEAPLPAQTPLREEETAQVSQAQPFKHILDSVRTCQLLVECADRDSSIR